MQLSVKEWRVRFTVVERDVRVIEIYSGFRDSQLAAGGGDESHRLHREFLAIWPREQNSVAGAPYAGGQKSAREAARMPCRMRVGLGGQPGTATSTGMTFETRPQLA